MTIVTELPPNHGIFRTPDGKFVGWATYNLTDYTFEIEIKEDGGRKYPIFTKIDHLPDVDSIDDLDWLEPIKETDITVMGDIAYTYHLDGNHITLDLYSAIEGENEHVNGLWISPSEDNFFIVTVHERGFGYNFWGDIQAQYMDSLKSFALLFL